MSGILRLESLTKGNTLKQGDKTPLKYRLFDADGENLNIAGKSAKVRLAYPDFLTIGYEKDGLTVAQDDTVTFTIDGVIPSRIYHVEIIVDGQFIFPSRADEAKFTVDKSSLGTETNIIEIVGVDAVVRKAVDLINEDPSLIIDEDKLISEIIANTSVGSIEEYYQEYRDAIKEYADLKPKALSAISKSDDAITLSESVQEQLNQVVIEGDSSVEASQARVNADGVAKATLKQRLDDEHNEVTAQLAQTGNPSLVNKMLGHINPVSLYATITSTGLEVGIGLLDSYKSGIKYSFLKNEDNLLLFRGGYIGERKPHYPTYTLNGTFNQASPPLVYTTNIGDSFEFEFEGTGFNFRRRIGPDSGLWEFRLSNGSQKHVSGYSPIGNNYTSEPVFKDLPYGEYSCVATFLGSDIYHDQTSPRGYLMYSSTSVPPTNQPIIVDNKATDIDSETQKMLSSNSTINDFAISASPANSGLNVAWVPQHSTASGVSVLIDRKILIDGVSINSNTLIKYGNIKSVEIIQYFDAINPNDSSKVLWKHSVSHKISLDKPYLEIANRLDFVEDTRIEAMYLTMLGVTTSNVNNLILSNGAEYDTIPMDDTYPKVEGLVSSALFGTEYKSGVYGGIAVDSLSYREAAGSDTEMEEVPTSLSLRSNGITKFYVNAYKGIANSGDVFKNTQRIAIVNGVRYPNINLRTI